MFCYQCEQTARGVACDKSGVCGKPPDVAALQDLLVYALTGLAQAAVSAGKAGIRDRAADIFTCEALFATVTNVDFDPERFLPLIRRAVELRDALLSKAGAQADLSGEAVAFKPASDLAGLVAQGEAHGVQSYPAADADILSLKHTLLYGIKGLAAYADHAQILGQTDEAVFDFFHEALTSLIDPKPGLEAMLGLVMKCGQVNLRVMELLDAANTGAYGHPVPTKVPLGPRKGKAILVSGHDLKDLEELLKQTEGKGIYDLHPRRDAARPRLSRAQEVSRTSTAITGPPGRTRPRSSTRSPAPS